MTREQFRAKYSNEDLDTAMSLLYDLASYYEIAEPYATNTIDAFRVAATHLPSDVNDL
jgi:hypothetical protein